MLLVALAIAVIGLGLIAAALAGRDRRDHRTARQLAAVERKLDAVLSHLGVDLTEVSYPEVERLLAAGKTVHAVKEYRKATGAGLLEAKTEIDRLERRRTATSAPTPAATPSPTTPAAEPAAAETTTRPAEKPAPAETTTPPAEKPAPAGTTTAPAEATTALAEKPAPPA